MFYKPVLEQFYRFSSNVDLSFSVSFSNIGVVDDRIPERIKEGEYEEGSADLLLVRVVILGSDEAGAHGQRKPTHDKN